MLQVPWWAVMGFRLLPWCCPEAGAPAARPGSASIGLDLPSLRSPLSGALRRGAGWRPAARPPDDAADGDEAIDADDRDADEELLEPEEAPWIGARP
jgi:hypothetical protein